MDILSTLILLGLVTALLILLRWRNKPHNLPPGPTALPLIGNIVSLDNRAPYKTFLKVSRSLQSAFSTYGYLGALSILLYKPLLNEL